jgi:hypothetical protein
MTDDSGTAKSRSSKMPEERRRWLLYVLDHLLPKLPKRPQAEAEAELREIRLARRHGGRRHPIP